MFPQTVSLWEDWTASPHQHPVHILRCLHLISSSLQFITLPGASSVDIADTRMMECNDLRGGLHNSTETGNKWEELASREAVAQHIIRVQFNKMTNATTQYNMSPSVTLQNDLQIYLFQATQKNDDSVLLKSVAAIPWEIDFKEGIHTSD